MIHEMPKLAFALDALQPMMSAETMECHYGKHLQSYLDNVNKMIVGTPYEDLTLKEIICTATGTLYNQAAQAWNHILFFKQLSPVEVPMGKDLQQALIGSFGSVEEFRKQLVELSLNLFGSGWVWLASDETKQLHLVAESNAGNTLKRGLRPLLCVDVWEHAYYLDYQNRRADYLENFWRLIDWARVEHRMNHNLWPLYF